MAERYAGADRIDITRAICGRVEATERESERSVFTYDGSLPISETRSGAAPATLAWTYNTDFAPTAFTYAGATQTYAYDADGLVVSAAPFTVARRADNALPTTVTASGFALERTYNTLDEADYGAYSYALTRDTAGRITQKAEETSGTTAVWGYAYDTLGRLATVTLDGELAESYAYDVNGNRTASRVPLRGIDETLGASFDAEDRATVVGDATYTYTPDGYLALKRSSEGTTTYAYSAFGELERLTLPDGREVSYTYDAAGRRTSKAIDGTMTARYLWADATRLLAVYDGAGVLQTRFLYADARVPYAADTPAGRIFFAFDQTGSLRAVTDAAETVLKTVAHDSFGNVIGDSNPALAVPLGFAGGLADSDTGLVLFGARDYDPALGRWIAKDPIGFAGGDANLYGYCLGDPVNLVDPSGLDCDCWRAWETWMYIASVAGMAATPFGVVAWATAGTVVGGAGAGAVSLVSGALAVLAGLRAAALKRQCLEQDAREAACPSDAQLGGEGTARSDGTGGVWSVLGGSGFVLECVGKGGLGTAGLSFMSTVSSLNEIAEVEKMRAEGLARERRLKDEII